MNQFLQSNPSSIRTEPITLLNTRLGQADCGLPFSGVGAPRGYNQPDQSDAHGIREKTDRLEDP